MGTKSLREAGYAGGQLDYEAPPVVRRRTEFKSIPDVPAAGSTSADLEAARSRYLELDRALASETNPARRVALMDEQAAVSEDFSRRLDPNAYGQPASTPPVGPPVSWDPQGPAMAAGPPDPEAGAGAPVQQPSLLDQAMQLAGRGGRSGNPAAVAAHSAAAARAGAEADAAHAKAGQALDTRAQLAGDAGEVQGDVLARGAAEMDALIADRKRDLAEQEARLADYRKARDMRVADYEREATKQGAKSVMESMSTGERIANAIAVGLGGFSAAMNGGPNVAWQIMKAGIDHEVDARAARLANAKGAIDELDKSYVRTLQETGDIGAAKSELASLMAKGVMAKAEEYAARFKGRDAAANFQQMRALYDEDEANRRAADEAKAAQANRGSAGDPLARLSKAADVLMKFQKLDKEVASAGGELEQLDADTRKHINRIDMGSEDLLQLRAATLRQLGVPPDATPQQLAAALKARGNDAVPGHERLLHEPGALAGRLARKFTGIGGGSSGLSPEQDFYNNQVEMTGISAYYAETNNSANLTGEQERAARSSLGNATYGGVLYNIDQRLARLRARREGLMRKNSPVTKLQQRERHEVQNPEYTNGGPAAEQAPPIGGRVRGR